MFVKNIRRICARKEGLRLLGNGNLRKCGIDRPILKQTVDTGSDRDAIISIFGKKNLFGAVKREIILQKMKFLGLIFRILGLMRKRRRKSGSLLERSTALYLLPKRN